MANTLMFEVGVKQAVEGLDKVKQQLDHFVASYADKMKIQVDIKNLEAFINALKTIGNGDQIKPLLETVERLQNRLASMGSRESYLDNVRAEAAGAAQALKNAEQAYERYRRAGAGNMNITERYRKDVEEAKVKDAEASARLASAEANLSNEEKKGAESAGLLNAEIKKLSESITALSGKTFSVNMGNEFKTWAEQVQALVVQVKELISQMGKLNQVQGESNSKVFSSAQTEEIKKQEKAIVELQKQLDYYKRAIERAGQATAEINSRYPNGMGQPWKDPAISAAIKEDEKLREQTIAELDKKWDAFWAKQEKQALQFAQALQKPLSEVTFDDFYKNLNGKMNALAKSWYANFHAEGYDRTLLFDADHEMRLMERLQQLRKERAAYKNSDEFSKANPAYAEELKMLEALKKRIDDYNNSRVKAFNAQPNASAAMDKFQADQNSLSQNATIIEYAKKKELEYTEAIAAAQQKLNELRAQGNVQASQPGNVFEPSKFTSLQEAIDKIVSEVNRLQQAFTKLGENDSLSNLATYINGLAVTLGTLSNSIKLQPLDEQTKRLLEENEKLRQKLIEVGEAAKHLNVRNGEKTQGKAASIQKIADDQARLNTETEKGGAAVDNLGTKYATLVQKIENWQAALSKLLSTGGHSNYFDSQIRSAIEAYQKLKENVQSGLAAGGSKEELMQLRSLMTLLGQTYANVNKEANAFNRAGEKQGQYLAESVRKAEVEYNNIERVIRQVNDLIARGTTAHINVDELQMVKHFLEVLQRDLREISSNGGTFRNSSSTTQHLMQQENVIKGLQGVKDAMSAYSKELRVAEQNMRQAENEANKLTVTISNLKALESKANAIGIDTTRLHEVIRQLEAYRACLNDIKATNSASTKGFITHESFLQTKRDIKEVTAAIKNDMKEAMKPDTSLANALKEYASIVRQITSLTKTANQAEKFGVDTTTIRSQIAALEQYRTLIEQIIGLGGHGLSNVTASTGYINARNNPVVEQASLNSKVAEEKSKNAQATQQLTAEEQRLAQTIQHSTREMGKQSQVLSDLKMMATQYLSVWGAQSFISSIIETGGLLEQQRLSIGAILGDMQQATELFEQIKALAVKSPFGVVELDRMSKQLTAYGFEYKELYDWTKRLADISAATGTEVSRLSLALGHVRSEGALSGYTLRQFAMANVPVLRMLSENLGISAKEVRERVSKKEISYEDVKDILKELTDEGGMFYNAQEVMSEALNAKLKNLRDAFDIMYGEIAEGGVGDMLKGILTTLMSMTKHWERVGKDILMVASAFGIMRTATMLATHAIGANTTATLKGITAAVARERANLRLAQASRIITKEEYSQAAAEDRLIVSSMKAALVENNLSVAELQRAVALGRVSQATAIAAVESAGLDAALIRQTVVLKGWNRSMFLMREGFLKAKTAAKSFFAAAWPLLALSAVFELFNRAGEQADEAAEAAERAAEATSKYGEIIALSERMGEATGKSAEELENGISEMEQALTSVGAYNNELREQVDAVSSLIDKYSILRRAMQGVAKIGEDTQTRTAALLEEALGVGGGSGWNPLNWFRDNVLKDAQDVDDYAKTLFLALDKNERILRTHIEHYLQQNGKWKTEYVSMSLKDIFMGLDESVKSDLLNLFTSPRWGSEIENAGWEIYSAYKKSEWSYLGALHELEGHMDDVIPLFKQMYKLQEPLVDLTPDTDDPQKIEFDKWLTNLLSSLKNLGAEGQKALHDMVITGTISVVPSYELDNSGWNDFLEDFKNSNPIGYQEWKQHGVGAPATIESQKQSATAYNHTFSGMSILSLGNDSKKRITELQKENNKLTAARLSAIYASDEAFAKSVEDQITKNEESIALLQQAQKDYNQYGDPDKNKGRGEDKNAKAVREKVRIMKEAADAFQYWREKVGESGAWSHVFDEFGDVLTEIGVNADNIQDLRAHLNKILESAEFAAIKDQKVKLEVEKEIAKELAQLDRKDFERDTERFVSALTRQIDELTRKWEIFNSVRESSGDTELAARLSGISPGATPADLKRANVAAFAGVGIDFKSVLGMSEEEIDRYVETLGVAEVKIKAIQNGLKDWQKAQQELISGDIQSYANWLGGLVDLETKRRMNQDEYNRILEETNRLLKAGLITEEEAIRRRGSAATQMNTKNWQDSRMYSNLYNNSLGMAREEFMEAYNKEIKSINDQFSAGSITVQEYDEKMRKLNGIMLEFSERGFLGIRGGVGSYLSGGIKGLIDYFRKRADASATDEDREKWNKRADALDKLQHSAEQVVSAFDQISKISGMLANMFDSLGMSGAANGFGDAASVLGGIAGGASAFSGMGPWGMAAGAVIGGITSIAQLHDKQNQRVIDALKEEVDALEMNTDAIKNARERTLGYDSGALRRRMAGQYRDTSVLDERLSRMYGQEIYVQSAAMKAMQQYYGANKAGTGYEQELRNLEAERQKYIDMYDVEADKKKVSQDSLDEYKKKIAELDDQIANFTEDLEKDLWGIDIQGWADQVSDAIMTAFENGEDAVEAFDDTVEDIMRNVAQNILKVGVIEPMFQRLRDRLTVQGGEENPFDLSDPSGSATRIYKIIADEFGNLRQQVPIMEEALRQLEEVSGWSLRNEDRSGSTGTSVKGITEQTADLLASYVNAIRASTAQLQDLEVQYLPLYLSAMTSGNASLRNIEEQARLTAMNTDAIKANTSEVVGLINGLKNRAWKLPMA